MNAAVIPVSVHPPIENNFVACHTGGEFTAGYGSFQMFHVLPKSIVAREKTQGARPKSTGAAQARHAGKEENQRAETISRAATPVSGPQEYARARTLRSEEHPVRY
jgi:hypothetical protein